LGLVVWLAGVFATSTLASPLPSDGVEEFRNLLDRERNRSTFKVIAPATLAQTRKNFREAEQKLTTLGDVSRVLLLTEWWWTDSPDPETPMEAETIANLLQMKDPEFEEELQKLLDKVKNDDKEAAFTKQIDFKIKEDSRERLLKRFTGDIGTYLRGKRSVDQIAAANLISETMSRARGRNRGESDSGYSEMIGQDRTPSLKRSEISIRDELRRWLSRLSGELRKLSNDSNLQVQIASVRALSNLETLSNPQAKASADLFKSLLNPKQNVELRRATAQALAEEADIAQAQSRSSLAGMKSLEQIVPLAALGLSDSDVVVRRHSLQACQKAVAALDEFVGERRSVLKRPGGPQAYKPLLNTLRTALPSLNNAARDPVPQLRVEGCHLLEILALVVGKIGRLDEKQLLPLPEPDKKDDKKVPLSSLPTVKQGQAALTAATLAKPEKLTTPPALRASTLPFRPVSYQAQKAQNLPKPAPVEERLKGTVSAMREGLKDPDYNVRLASVEVLEMLSNQELLGMLGNQVVASIPDLVTAMTVPNDRSRDPNNKNKFVRWAAARTLGRLAPRQAYPHLVKALDDPNQKIRQDAAVELERIATQQAKLVVPALMRLLNDQEDLGVRIAAANALEQYGPYAKAAVRKLAFVINRGDKEYIIAVLHALQGIGTEAQIALPNVAWIMRNRELSPDVRVEAAQTLGRFGPLAKGQLPDLREVMVNDPDIEVRQAASIAALAVDRQK
jgi:HEAT repeat protein